MLIMALKPPHILAWWLGFDLPFVQEVVHDCDVKNRVCLPRLPFLPFEESLREKVMVIFAEASFEPGVVHLDLAIESKRFWLLSHVNAQNRLAKGIACAEPAELKIIYG